MLGIRCAKPNNVNTNPQTLTASAGTCTDSEPARRLLCAGLVVVVGGTALAAAVVVEAIDHGGAEATVGVGALLAETLHLAEIVLANCSTASFVLLAVADSHPHFRLKAQALARSLLHASFHNKAPAQAPISRLRLPRIHGCPTHSTFWSFSSLPQAPANSHSPPHRKQVHAQLTYTTAQIAQKTGAHTNSYAPPPPQHSPSQRSRQPRTRSENEKQWL